MFNFFKKKEEEVKEIAIFAVCDGEFLNIEEVQDEVFAQKMMGDGFAVVPNQGDIVAPIQGKVVNVFPTKHAIGFEGPGNVEVLLHMGIDTVSLKGEPFNVLIEENQKVSGQEILVQVDLEKLAEAGKDNAMIVVFTNGQDVIDRIEFSAEGSVTKGQEIGRVYLK